MTVRVTLLELPEALWLDKVTAETAAIVVPTIPCIICGCEIGERVSAKKTANEKGLRVMFFSFQSECAG
jgi:hypothetical protein